MQRPASESPNKILAHMSYSLDSLKGDIWRLHRVPVTGFIGGDTGSLDYGSYMALADVSGPPLEKWRLSARRNLSKP